MSEQDLEAKIATAVENEQSRWQMRFEDIRDDGFDWIDGGGCDSGDPLDFTHAEVWQRINFYINQTECLERIKAAAQRVATMGYALTGTGDSGTERVNAEFRSAMMVLREALK